MTGSTDTHPDLADLDSVRTGEAPPDVVAHVAACAVCQAGVAELRAFAGAFAVSAPEVPEEIEARILWGARTQAAKARRAARRLPPAGVLVRRAIAVAAGVLVAVGLFRAPGPWHPAGPSAVAMADVDRNGVVDVRDAFVIARALRAGGGLPPAFDVNGDGRVDGDDVSQVARAAVALGNRS